MKQSNNPNFSNKIILLTLLTMVQLNITFSQNCNCYYNFGTSSSSTSNWSSCGTGGNGNIVDRTICVQGKLIIDVDASFLTCTFFMYPGSSIKVSNNKIFKASNTTFQRCGNEMWKGIETTWGSQLDFNHNTISDAITGIYCDPNSTILQFIQNGFNRCSIGVEAYEIIATRPFVGNRFYSDGTMLSPKTGYPFAGMRIFNTAGLISERSGFYEHMNWGIELNNSNYIGENITMQNGPTVATIINPGIGITASGSNITINHSTFRRIPFGIWSDQGSAITATNNAIHNVLAGISIQNSPNLSIIVNNNTLDTVSTLGIAINDCSPYLGTLVSDNMIVFGANSIYGQPNMYCMGITLDNSDRIESGREISLLTNHVYQNTAVPPNFYGYFLYNAWSVRVSGNTADFGQTNSFPEWGFYINNCSLMNLDGNTITGAGTYSPLSTGIYLRKTDFSSLCCNTTQSIDVGTEFDDVCLNTRIRGSNFNGPYTHNALLFTNTVTAIEQNYPGNDWLGVAPFDARYVGNPLIAMNDRFVVSTTGLPFHPDNPIDGPSGWFVRPMNPLGESSCSQDQNCDGFPESFCDDFPNDQLLLVDGYSGLHGEGLTWQARKIVLKEFWKDPDFGCNTTMVNNFKSAHQNSNLGLLAHIANDVNSMLNLSLETRQSLNNLSNTMTVETQAIIPIDSMWEVEGADLEYWIQQRDNHLLNLINAWVEYHSIITTIHSDVLEAIPAIQTELSNIIPSNIMEENDIFVTGIYLEKLLDPNFTLSSAQLSTLNEIADQCPLDGGDGVLRARSILKILDPNNFHAGATCDSIIGLRSNNDLDKGLEIFVTPNPNLGIIDINIIDNSKEPNYSIKIYDMNGLIIKKLNTSQKKINLVLGNGPGVYFINIINQNGLSYNQKLLTF